MSSNLTCVQDRIKSTILNFEYSIWLDSFTSLTTNSLFALYKSILILLDRHLQICVWHFFFLPSLMNVTWFLTANRTISHYWMPFQYLLMTNEGYESPVDQLTGTNQRFKMVCHKPIGSGWGLKSCPNS